MSDLDSLKVNDIYSLILFALYKYKNIPQYSTLSELVYILDKDSLLKLCEYFGGMTIKIPTIEDIEILIYALLVYQKVDIQGEDFSVVLKELELKSFRIKQIKEAYQNLLKVMEDYEFNARE